MRRLSRQRACQPPAPHGVGGLAVYYGFGEVERLASYGTVVLQPGAHTSAEVAHLRARGVRVLAYLSLGEEVAETQAAWHARGHWGHNAEWGTRRVRPGHPLWVARMREQARGLSAEFDGLFLDTLDSHGTRRGSSMLRLLRAVRAAAPGAYLLANRGASLLPRLGPLVDGVLIEALSTTWERDYDTHDEGGLNYTAALLSQVRACGLEAWGLDYANRPELTAFAQRRAHELGIQTFVTTRSLDVLPDGEAARSAS